MIFFLQKKALYAVKNLIAKKNIYTNHKRAKMTIVSKSKSQRKRQKQARKRQRKIKINKRQRMRTPLTPEPKIVKKKKKQNLKENKKEMRKKKEKEAESIIAKQIHKQLSSIFTSKTLDALAKVTGFIKRKGGELLPYAYMYIIGLLRN